MKNNSKINIGCAPTMSTLFLLILITILGSTGNIELGHKILIVYLWFYGICSFIGAMGTGVYIALMTGPKNFKELITSGALGFLAGFSLIGIPTGLVGLIIWYVGNTICL